MNHELVNRHNVLDEKGNVIEAGFSKKEILDYNRKQIKVANFKIKEWDYYYIGNNDYGFCVTVADNGYVGSLSLTLLDFNKKTQITKSQLLLFPLGKMKMSNVWPSNYNHNKSQCGINLETKEKSFRLYGYFKKFKDNKELKFDFEISDYDRESMFILTPFNKKKHFYYNRKLNNMTCKGEVSIEEEKILFNKKNTQATLDWGRGVWTYSNTWYWGSLSGFDKDGNKVGFNLGYGFGDTSKASENMIFFDKLSHKVDLVDFNIPGDKEGSPRYLDEYHVLSNDGKVDLIFKPILDRYEPINLGLIAMIPHQVFGVFTGKLVLDDGRIIELKESVGFIEKVHNRW